ATAGGVTDAWLAVAPSGERLRVGEEGPPTLETREPGFYELRPLGGTGRARPLAVNADPEEGDLTPMDPELVTVALADASVQTAGGGAATTAADDEERQALWWWILATLLLLLGAEAAMANRVTMRTR